MTKIKLTGQMVDVETFAVWCPEANIVEICLNGQPVMQLSPEVAVQMGRDLIAHGRSTA